MIWKESMCVLMIKNMWLNVETDYIKDSKIILFIRNDVLKKYRIIQ
nr:hypothetical protein [Bacteroidota bacterium]